MIMHSNIVPNSRSKLRNVAILVNAETSCGGGMEGGGVLRKGCLLNFLPFTNAAVVVRRSSALHVKY